MMDLNTQEHSGCVLSRTHDTCLVAEPVAIVIEGQEIEISLRDAKLLMSGLQKAVARVEESESSLKGDGVSYSLAVIGKAGAGMSCFPITKLGAGGPVVDRGLYGL
jgi:hypothetical protein